MRNLCKLVAIFSITVICLSCNPDETPEQSIHGTWELIEIRSHWTQAVLRGDDIGGREFYTFNPNGTFTKSSVGTELDHHVSGTYTISAPDPTVEGNVNLRSILDLTFNANVNSEMVYGCNIVPDELRADEELSEQLYLSVDGFLRNLGCPLIADLNWYVFSKN